MHAALASKIHQNLFLVKILVVDKYCRKNKISSMDPQGTKLFFKNAKISTIKYFQGACAVDVGGKRENLAGNVPMQCYFRA